MSKDHQKGRADASAGKDSKPPHEGLGEMLFMTKEERSKIPERAEEYREGYHDKRREIRDEKKK